MTIRPSPDNAGQNAPACVLQLDFVFLAYPWRHRVPQSRIEHWQAWRFLNRRSFCRCITVCGKPFRMGRSPRLATMKGVSYVERGFGGRFWSLIGATFLGFVGIGTVLPGLAPHIRNDLGGSDQSVGVAIGTFSVVALLSRFFSGPLADRRGRKLAFLTGLASCGVAGGAYLLPLGIAGPYVGRALQGFGEACLYTGAAAWVVEL